MEAIDLQRRRMQERYSMQAAEVIKLTHLLEVKTLYCTYCPGRRARGRSRGGEEEAASGGAGEHDEGQGIQEQGQGGEGRVCRRCGQERQQQQQEAGGAEAGLQPADGLRRLLRLPPRPEEPQFRRRMRLGDVLLQSFFVLIPTDRTEEDEEDAIQGRG